MGECLLDLLLVGVSNWLTVYRFGAVLEEFEVRDALMAVFAGKGIGSASNTTPQG